MVLIKDMEMPKNCAHCSLKNYGQGRCLVNGKRLSGLQVNGTAPKPAWCPLVEVDQYGPEGLMYKEK